MTTVLVGQAQHIKVLGVCDESHTVAARDLYVDALRLTTQSPIPS